MSLKKSELCRPSQNIWPMITVSSRIQIRGRRKEADQVHRMIDVFLDLSLCVAALFCVVISQFHMSLSETTLLRQWPREFRVITCHILDSAAADLSNERGRLLLHLHRTRVIREQEEGETIETILGVTNFVILCYLTIR